MPAAGPDAAAAPFMPDARVRHFENVCIHVGFKGTMSRQGYAWLESAADGSPRVPDQPHFSRHVDFIGSARELRSVRPWWRPRDVNRSIRGFRTSASDLQTADQRPARWVRGASWFVDISHGGTPNLWSNVCHWSNTMLPVFEAAYRGGAITRALSHVVMWQVPRGEARLGNESYHGGLLRVVTGEMRRRRRTREGGAPAERLADAVTDAEPVAYLYDEDLPAGGTVCFEEAVVAREPNLRDRKMQLQTRASMSSAGVARGFSTPAIRAAFRAAVLRYLRLPPAAVRVPTVTHLSRPASSWQQRSHLTAKTFRSLKELVRREAGFDLVRATFEKTAYAYQARVVSQTDVFWAAHGAGLVHMPLLPPGAVVIEMFNCGHFSYLCGGWTAGAWAHCLSRTLRGPYVSLIPV